MMMLTPMRHQAPIRYRIWPGAVHHMMMMAAAVIMLATVCVTVASEVNTDTDHGVAGASGSDNFVADIGYDEKRNWQALKGAWGKRSSAAWVSPVDGPYEDVDGETAAVLAERWVPVLVSNSAGDSSGNNNNDWNNEPALKYSLVYLANGAAMPHLGHQSGIKGFDTDAAGTVDSGDFIPASALDDNSIIGDGDILNEKRSWKSMNMAWGKRRNAPTWNKFRGAWGKREPGWNNLKGMWGKRQAKDWARFHGGWGKRSALN